MATAQVREVLEVVRCLKAQNLSEAIETVSQGTEKLCKELGTNVHPDLAILWLEYGDLLLQQTEEALLPIGQTGSPSSCNDTASANLDSIHSRTASSSTDPVGLAASTSTSLAAKSSDPDDNVEKQSPRDDEDEDEDDLLLAYECLEIARRCFELQKEMPLANLRERAKLHRRLSDFKMIQSQLEVALIDSRESLTLFREAAVNEASLQNSQDVDQQVKAELACVDVREAMGHLMILAKRTNVPPKSVIGDDVPEQLLFKAFLQHEPDLSPDDGFDQKQISTEIQPVSVRQRKRKHQDEIE